jgi:hypothetical protein
MSALLRLRDELAAAEHVLATQFSFELAEPNYRRCLRIISEHPERREEIGTLLIAMLNKRVISAEPLAYLMHCLRWGEVEAAIADQLSSMSSPMIHGRELEKILEAFSDKWENHEFYCFK